MLFDYLQPDELLPLPPPDGLPVVLGPFGGVEPPFALLVVIIFLFFVAAFVNHVGRLTTVNHVGRLTTQIHED